MHSLDAFFATVKLPSISEVAHALIQTLNDDNAGCVGMSRIGQIALGRFAVGALE